MEEADEAMPEAGDTGMKVFIVPTTEIDPKAIEVVIQNPLTGKPMSSFPAQVDTRDEENPNPTETIEYVLMQPSCGAYKIEFANGETAPPDARWSGSFFQSMLQTNPCGVFKVRVTRKEGWVPQFEILANATIADWNKAKVAPQGDPALGHFREVSELLRDVHKYINDLGCILLYPSHFDALEEAADAYLTLANAGVRIPNFKPEVKTSDTKL